MSSIVIQAWTVIKTNNDYYLPYTHWIYLKEIAQYYKNIWLLSPVKLNSRARQEGLLAVSSIGNIKVHELPYSDSYTSAIKHFKAYYKAYKGLKNYDNVYVRYPVPFGWLSKIYFKKKNRVIHFVGDPIDAAKNNPNFSRLRKFVLTSFFIPEHLAYMWACRGAKVFTNGHHLKQRLEKYKIKANALISSTLNEEDFYFEENKYFKGDNLKLLYVGYLRKAKGLETVLKAFKLINNKYPNASLTVVGTGEFEKQLKTTVQELELTQKVTFTGHVDKRSELNKLLRSHHIFCFASLSEGSPRVILEAMANGLNVVSTPVGSLPSIFEDGRDIVFSEFNDEKEFARKIEILVNDREQANKLRSNAFNKVKTFTIEHFIKAIFHEN